MRKGRKTDLPPPNTRRWTMYRKAAVLEALRSGRLTVQRQPSTTACRSKNFDYGNGISSDTACAGSERHGSGFIELWEMRPRRASLALLRSVMRTRPATLQSSWRSARIAERSLEAAQVLRITGFSALAGRHSASCRYCFARIYHRSIALRRCGRGIANGLPGQRVSSRALRRGAASGLIGSRTVQPCSARPAAFFYGEK